MGENHKPENPKPLSHVSPCSRQVSGAVGRERRRLARTAGLGRACVRAPGPTVEENMKKQWRNGEQIRNLQENGGSKVGLELKKELRLRVCLFVKGGPWGSEEALLGHARPV